MDSGYQQQKLDGDRVRFTVTPATVKAPLIFQLLGALLGGLICTGLLGGRNELWQAVVGLAGAWIGWKLAVRVMTAKIENYRSSGGTFVVSPSGLETSTGIINREQLHRVTLTNGIPRAGDDGVVVEAGTTAADAVTFWQRTVRPVAWKLCAEAGGRSTTLAGGMNDVTARGLLTDVSKLLGLGV
jgi:hypothetical protein